MNVFLIILILLTLLLVAWEWHTAFQIGNRARHVGGASAVTPLVDWPSVSVLIPAWQEAGTIARCLEALGQVKYPDWEVIVIAGGADRTYELVQQLPCAQSLVLIEQAEGGKNAALTQGLAVAHGAIIVVLDADSVVAPEWLHALIRPLTLGASASCGNYIPLRETWVSRVEEMEKIAAYCIRGECILQGSGSIAVQRAALEGAGGFPASVLVGVDWDLDTRLAIKGFMRSFASDALVWTERPSTLAQFWENEVRWRRAHLQSLFRYRLYPFGEGDTLVQSGRIYLIVLALGLGCIAGIACLAMGWSSLATAIFLAEILALGWMIGRRAALAGAITGYTGDRRWLSLAWAPAALLLVNFAASWWAVITLRRRIVHFQGPRP